MENPINKPNYSKEEAIAAIDMLKNNAWTAGANDSEIPDINKILEALNAGKITPDQAVDLAYKIYAGKNMYH